MNAAVSDGETDLLLPFHIPDLGVHGRVVRLGPALAAMVRGHGYPPPVARMLAESAALAAALAGGLKYDGVFTLQVSSDGPVSTLVADVTSEGAVRGYARLDAARAGELAAASVNAPVPGILGAGHMAFTVDQGPDTERYQGITELAGATLADCAHAYFRRSEQLETAVRIASRAEPAPPPAEGTDGAEAPRAAAFILQRLPAGRESGGRRPSGDPEEEADRWRRAVIFLASVSERELLDPALAPEQLLHRLFHEEHVRVESRRPLRHACRCSRERVARTLASFPRAEIEEFKEKGRISVTCEFCKAVYDFDEGDIARLYPS